LRGHSGEEAARRTCGRRRPRQLAQRRDGGIGDSRQGGRTPGGSDAPTPEPDEPPEPVLPEPVGDGDPECVPDGFAVISMAASAAGGAWTLLPPAVAVRIASRPAAVPLGTAAVAWSSSDAPLAMPPTWQVRPLALGHTVNLGVTPLAATVPLIVTVTPLAEPPAGHTQIAKVAVPPACRLDLLVMGCTSRHSWAGGGRRVGLGDGLDVVGLGEGLGVVVLLGLGDGLAVVGLVALGDGLAVVTLGDGLAAWVLSGLGDALAALGEADEVVLDETLGVALFVASALEVADPDLVARGGGDLIEENETASSTTAVRPAGMERTAAALAGGTLQMLGADTRT